MCYAEWLWRGHHPKQAIAVMVVANAFVAALAARNQAVR